MDLSYTVGQTFEDFFAENKDRFNELLLAQGKELIENIRNATAVIDEAFLLKSANEIVYALNEFNDHALILHAKEHGRNWATPTL